MLKNVVDVKKAYKVLVSRLKKLHPLQLGLVIFLFVSAVLGVYLVQREIKLRLQAQVGVVDVFFSPSTSSVPPNSTINLQMNVDPANNVGFIDIEGNFDPNLLHLTQEIEISLPNWNVLSKTSMANANSTGTFNIAVYPDPASGGTYITGLNTVAKLTFDQNSAMANQNAVISINSSSAQLFDSNSIALTAKVTPGTVMVNPTGSARLYFSNPGTKEVGSQFTLSIYGDTNGQDVDGIDALISFNPNVLNVVDVVEGTEPGFTSYPLLDWNNQTGSISVSANIGTAANPTPVNGSSVHLADIIFSADAIDAGTPVTFNFTPGDRNDSNMVLSGTWNTQDPVDILQSVNNTNVTINDVVIIPTNTPTSTPSPTATPTPVPGARYINHVGSNRRLSSNGSTLSLVTSSSTDFNNHWLYEDAGSGYIRIKHSSSGKYLYAVSSTTAGLTTSTGNNAQWSLIMTPDNNTQYYILNRGLNVKLHNNGTSTVSVIDPQWTGPNVRWTQANVDGTPIATPIPTQQPTNIPTSTPKPTNTPVLPTNTPSPSSVTVKVKLQGKLRTGVSNAATMDFYYREAGKQNVTQKTLATNSAGEAIISIVPGNYVFLVDAPGYLARRFGSDTNPVVITGGGTILDISNPILLGGDFNGDGEVNEVDYTLNMLPNFGVNSDLVDLDESGAVNNLDYVIMRSNWNLIEDQI